MFIYFIFFPDVYRMGGVPPEARGRLVICSMTFNNCL
jgi:hypothetical protein